MSSQKRLTGLFLLVLILLLAFALRIYTLGDFNYNWDEGWSNWIVQLPYDDMILTTAADVHPPLYYHMLRFSQSVAGQGEFINRFPSVLLGLLTVALAYGFGRAVGGYRLGLLAMLLMAISRANIDISQLSRMHILATMFATAALWATVRIWQNPRRRGAMLVYVLSTAGALYSFYLALMLPLATNLAFVIVWLRSGRSRRLLCTWIGLQIAAVLLFLPWALYALGLMHGWQSEDSTSLFRFLQFYAVILTTGIPAFWENYRPLVLLVLVLVGGGTGYIIYTRRRAVQATNQMVLLVIASITPALVVFLLILPIHNLGRPLAGRYLPLLAAAFYVLAAWGVVALFDRQRVVGAVSGIVIVGVSLFGLSSMYDARVLRDDFHSLGATLTAYRQPDDAVVFNGDRLWPHLYAAYTGARVDFPYREELDWPYANDLLTPVWEQSEAIWLVQTPESVVSDPTGVAESWLAERAIASRTWRFNENTLTVYARTEERAATLDHILPDQSIPPAPPNAIGLVGVDVPFDRLPVGDSVNLLLYWDTVPDESFTIDMTGQGETYSFGFDPPAEGDTVTRQHVPIPITSDIVPGMYTLTLDDIVLGSVTVVSFIPDATANVDSIQYPLNWRFGESVELLGFNLESIELVPGQQVNVTLFWRTDATLTERYKVLVYVIGEFNPASGNPLWGQQDSEPLNWRLPTTQWPVNTVLQDMYTFELFGGTPPGDYALGVVMYRLSGGERLLITDANGESLGDTAILTPVTVR